MLGKLSPNQVMVRSLSLGWNDIKRRLSEIVSPNVP